MRSHSDAHKLPTNVEALKAFLVLPQRKHVGEVKTRAHAKTWTACYYFLPPMESNPHATGESQKPLRIIGAVALTLGLAHAGLAAMHWNQHIWNARAFEFAAVGALVPFIFAFAIAGRTPQRDWNRIALWFLLWSLIILPFLTHVRFAA